MDEKKSAMHSEHRRTANRGDRVAKTIRKAPPLTAASRDLVGRRVSIPQRFTEVEDDGDGFCFGARVIGMQGKLCLVKYDYTGDIERYSVALVRTWISDIDDDVLEAFSRVTT